MSRIEQIMVWLSEHLETYQLEALGGDASFRRYFRVTTDEGDCLLMDSPPDKEPVEPFVRIDRFLESSGVRVPKILVAAEDDGLLLIEDFGNQLFAQALPSNHQSLAAADLEQADQLYRLAIDTLVHMQRVSLSSAKSAQIPAYSEAKLIDECSLFDQWFLPFLGSDKKVAPVSLTTLYAELAVSMQAQPQVLVHRDYHSRNLMMLDAQIGLIDFQDAVTGAVTYDVVSLLRDAYVAFSEKQINEWSRYAFDQQQRAGHLSGDLSFSDYELMLAVSGLQRGLKVLGIFVRLSERDGKTGYLADLPRVMQQVIVQMKIWQNAHAHGSMAQSAISADQAASLLGWFEDLQTQMMNKLTQD